MKSQEIAKRKPVKHAFDPPYLLHPEVPSSLKPVPHSDRAPTIRIIVPSGSSGTDFDAWLYQSLLPFAVIVYIDQEAIDSYHGPTKGQHFDVNFYIERILGKHIFPSTYEWVMANQEMLRVQEEPLEGVDLILCKSKFAQRLLSRYLGSLRATGEAGPSPKKVRYVGHGSRDLATNSQPKDYSLAIHPAGKSWLKGTYRLLKAWIAVNPPATLIVTCREMCMDPTKIQRLLTYHFTYDSASGKHVWSNGRSKIELAGFLSADILGDLQSRAGLWLCPSEVEGYGHYINEGRSAGATVMTTDFPPMNELIDTKSGFLVTVDEKTRIIQEGQLPGSKRVFPRVKNIKRTLVKIFNTPRSDLEKLGREARQRYERDLEFLSSGMKQIVNDFSS